jgi:O-antigen/teichoic acid export membrane protein
LAGVIIFNAIPTCIFILLAHPIVSILTYGRYTASTQFAQILAVKNIPLAACFLSSNVIIGYGYPRVELVNRAIGAIVCVLLFQYLIGHFGFYGAAWGQSIALVLMTSISALFILFKYLVGRKPDGEKNLLRS